MCPKYYDPQLVRKGSVDFTDSGERQTEYTYNADGALSGDANRGIAKIDYDACGYPRRVQFMDGSVTEYVYTVTGVKLRTVHRTAVPGISVAFGQTRELTEGETLSADSTDYLGNLILEDGVPSEYLFEGGYCSLDGDGISYHYYDRDHQGNIRAVVNSDGTVEQIMNYYPFGAPFSDNTAMNPDLQPYKYNGKEFESMHGRHAYDYGARFYAPLLPTWDRMDPLCEKYYHVSPYAYCANDPVNRIDLFGLRDYDMDELDDEEKWKQFDVDKDRIVLDELEVTLEGSDKMGLVIDLIGNASTAWAGSRYTERPWGGGYFRTSRGKYYSFDDLEIHENGKYRRGVQGLRYAKEYARNAAKPFARIGNIIGAYNLYNSLSSNPNSLKDGIDILVDIASLAYWEVGAIYYSTCFLIYITKQDRDNTMKMNERLGLPPTFGLYNPGLGTYDYTLFFNWNYETIVR